MRKHLGLLRSLLSSERIGCSLDLDGYSCAQENWEIFRVGLQREDNTTNHPNKQGSGSVLPGHLLLKSLWNFPLL